MELGGVEDLGVLEGGKGETWKTESPSADQFPCSLEEVDTGGFGMWVTQSEASTGVTSAYLPVQSISVHLRLMES